MTSLQADTRKALALWNRIPSDKQQQLLNHRKDGFCIELEVKQPENKLIAKVVNILFEMELDLNTKKLYLGFEEIEQLA